MPDVLVNIQVGLAGPGSRATGPHAGSRELAEFAPAGGPQPEPGATATELAGHNRPEVVDSIRAQFGQRMAAEDIADITYIITRPRHVAADEMLIRPTGQEQYPRPGGVPHHDQPAAWAMIGMAPESALSGQRRRLVSAVALRDQP